MLDLYIYAKCKSHSVSIDTFYNDIVNACIEAGQCTLPHKVNVQKKKQVPGWSEYVESFKKEALSWHNLWKNNGSPRAGFIAEMRNKSLAQYHFAVRFVHKNNESIIANRMASNLLDNSTCKFWKDVKKVKCSKQMPANTVDNKSGSEQISNIFANKYDELYNSVSLNKEEMVNFLHDNDHDIDNVCCNNMCYSSHEITTRHIIDSIQLLKPNKNEGSTSCSTNHLIHACERLYVYLGLLFNSMLYHGVSSSKLVHATIIPIPKDKRKSLNDSNNYRAIALSSVISKVLDITILNSNRNVLDTCDLQFGFKKKHSTTQCTFVYNEVIQYYLNNDSDVYVMMLDCSKAFDRVHYVKLFSVLKKKGLCPMLIRLLIQMYINQSLCVKWGSQLSRDFNVTNGVKQGGILSPVLFTVYIDELLLRLKKSGVGCYIGNMFLGGLGYADDGGLLAPSVTSLKIMMQICEEFGKEYNVLFNAGKYQLLYYSNNPRNNFKGIFHNGILINVQKEACHLGHPVGSQGNHINIEKGINSFVVAFNGVNSCFSNAHNDVKYKLFKNFCMPLYGCVLWDFTSKFMLKFYTEWRKCIRKLLNLPLQCHCLYLPLIVNDLPVEAQVYKRFIKFSQSMVRSNNECVKLCAKLMLNGSNSSCCKNLNHVSQYFKTNKYDIISSFMTFPGLLDDKINSMYSEADFINTGNIKDLLLMREVKNTRFSRIDINFMLEYMCTN